MGYRKLLKDYISHVEAVVGTDMIDLAALTNALSKRDIGELRSMSAELKRESFMHSLPADHDHTVKQMLENGSLQLADLRLLTGINAAAPGGEDSLTDGQFQMFVQMLLDEARSADKAANSE